MASIGGIFKAGSIIEQFVLWGLLNQVVGAELAPYLSQLQQDAEKRTPVEPLQPPDLADAVVRNYMSRADATAEAAKSGLDAGRFETLIPLHGDAPGPQQLAQALLRGIIPEKGTGANAASFEQGILEGRLADKWLPMIRALAQQILSPADAAEATVRNFVSPGDAAKIAAQNGVDANTFSILRNLAGDAPGPQQLAEALRRGLIPEKGTGAASTSFQQGVAEGRLADKWTDTIKGLSQLWPSPVDALQAELEGQLPHDQALALYEKLGGDPQFYKWQFDTRGSAPTPSEAVDMANRGIIPWTGTGPDATSYEQAFLEGPWRNKWEDAFRKEGEYIIPARTVTTLITHGAITDERATQILMQHGMTKEDATAYVASAHSTAIDVQKQLAVSEITTLYQDQAIDNATAGQMLESLGYSAGNAKFILAIQDLQRERKFLESAISRVKTLYTDYKLTRVNVTTVLSQLKVPAAQVTQLLATWTLERSANVPHLTESQIASAFYYKVMTQAEATAELEQLGYLPYDAWVILSNRVHAPQPGKPARTAAPTVSAT